MSSPGWPSRFEIVPVDQMFSDSRYQRPLSKAFVKKIAGAFEPALVGALTVNRRNAGKDKGRYAVIDGQTRAEAFRELGIDSAPCLVYEGLSAQQEAELFHRFQKERRQLTRWDRYVARLFSGDPDARKLKRAVEKAGFHLEQKADDPTAITAIGATEVIYERGGEKLIAETLGILSKAWPDLPHGATRSEVIRAVSTIKSRNGVTNDQIVAAIGKQSPDEWMKQVEVKGGSNSTTSRVVDAIGKEL